ncbi:flagellin [Halobacterium salinarum]|uniref:flagellin n=1 Tax=Halobacterium salinarum TaxID=2242 RepID=UPI0025560377|nr:flagellin [Halobacterium salinarum]MDL0138838.1 flagellin [Halobacterium salinarum]
MASVSSAHLVLFIAAILFSAALAGALTDSATIIGDSVNDAAGTDVAHANTAFSVVSDPGAPNSVYNDTTDTLTILVKNTGDSTPLSDPRDITVLVDGEYQTPASTAVVSANADTWRPGTLLRVEVTVDLAPNTETRVVVDASGHRDHFTFTTS